MNTVSRLMVIDHQAVVESHFSLPAGRQLRSPGSPYALRSHVECRWHQPKYDDSKPRRSRRAAAPASGSGTLDDLEGRRVFRPLIDHLVDNAPLHRHFAGQEVVALERVLDLLE